MRKVIVRQGKEMPTVQLSVAYMDNSNYKEIIEKHLQNLTKELTEKDGTCKYVLQEDK